MQDISLHLLDIIENSVRAKAKNIVIEIVIEVLRNKLIISVKDDGLGMDETTLQKAQDPFYTTKVERVKKIGLGIPLFKQNAEMCNGRFSICSEPGKGTDLIAEFQFDHVDRLPLGNLEDTMLTLIVGHLEIDFHFSLIRKMISGDDLSYDLSTAVLKRELGDVPLSYPDVIRFIESDIKQGIIKTKMEEF